MALARNYAPYPVNFSRGKDCHLWDENGKQYIDMMSAYSSVSLGHGHPRILKVLREQSAKLSMTSRAYKSDLLEALAHRLEGLTQMDFLPMNTGAEAVETAIKACRRYGTDRRGQLHPAIIVCNGNFHGRTTTIVGFSNSEDSRRGFGPFCGGFIHVDFGRLDKLKEVLDSWPHISAFIVEPIQGEAGVIVPPHGYLAEAQQLCKDYDVLFIVDEVQSGLARTGEWFAHYHDYTQKNEYCFPDGIIVGKALGGGVMPVSGFLAKRDLMDVFTSGSHGSTFGGNQLACAVALEALNVIDDEGLNGNSWSKGQYMIHTLREELADIELVKEVRGRGLWAGIELRQPCLPKCLELLEAGIVTKDTHTFTIRVAPPLTISYAILDEAIAKIVKVLKNVENTTRDDGGA